MPGLTSSSSSQTTSGSSNSASSNTGASVSLPTFNGLNDLMGQLASYSQSSFQNPTSQLAPIRNAALDQINTEYNNVPNQVSAQLASRGYGSSGLTGSALTQVALQKAGAQSSLEGQLAQSAIQQQQYGGNLAASLLGLDKGVNTQTSGDTSSNGSSVGTSNYTGTPSILSSIEGLASLLLGGSNPIIKTGGSN